jgi:hypothetical protein
MWLQPEALSMWCLEMCQLSASILTWHLPQEPCNFNMLPVSPYNTKSWFFELLYKISFNKVRLLVSVILWDFKFEQFSVRTSYSSFANSCIIRKYIIPVFPVSCHKPKREPSKIWTNIPLCLAGMGVQHFVQIM